MQQLKVFTKEMGNTNSLSIEIQFNKWIEENTNINVISTQFFAFNKVNPDNSIDKQYMCCSVLYFLKD